jgi:hypothetical protein
MATLVLCPLEALICTLFLKKVFKEKVIRFVKNIVEHLKSFDSPKISLITLLFEGKEFDLQSSPPSNYVID